MPLTMPRSTAQITGCSMAAAPNGQWLFTMRSWLPRFSAWAAKPCAVRASATACSAARNERWPFRASAGARRPWPGRTRSPTSSAIASACGRRQQGQCPAEQGEHEIVGADTGTVEGDLLVVAR